jgi:2-polyprenyl-3-methyl-5-hydroxy-6-metoxy-1,4-benzoquinol methylase
MATHRVKKHFDREAFSYSEKRNKGMLYKLVRREKETLFELLKVENGEEILDAGCGDGNYSKIIKDSGAIPFGVDISFHMIKKYKSLGFDGVTDDLSKMKLKRNFDKILCAGSIEFVKNPEETIINLVSHLKNNGLIVWLFPRKSIGGFLYKFYHLIINQIRIHLFSISDIEYITNKNNLNILDCKRSDFITSAIKIQKK